MINFGYFYDDHAALHMNTYKYIIVDDEDLDRLAINAYLKKYPFLRHLASFSTATSAKKFLDIQEIDILFLDIEMPDIDGVTLLSQIREKVLCPVFITSHTEYALKAFDLDATDYIIKPLKAEKIASCISKVKMVLDAKYKANLYNQIFKDESLLLKDGSDYIPIDFSDIVYLKAMKDYTQVISLYKKPITIHGNLASVLRDERFNTFIRIHKSYAIQKKHILEIGSDNITLINKTKLPLSSTYKKDILGELL